jgi:hypothetical protein
MAICSLSATAVSAVSDREGRISVDAQAMHLSRSVSVPELVRPQLLPASTVHASTKAISPLAVTRIEDLLLSAAAATVAQVEEQGSPRQKREKARQSPSHARR